MRRFSGQRLKELRERAGLTQEELARRVQYRYSSGISRIEAGEQVPRPRKIKALAKILNVVPEQLFAEVEDTVMEAK